MQPTNDDTRKQGTGQRQPSDEFASFADDLREHVGGTDEVDIWGIPVGDAMQNIETAVQETVYVLSRDEFDEKKWDEFKDFLQVFAGLDSLLENKTGEIDRDMLQLKIKEIETKIQEKAPIISHSVTAPIHKFLEIMVESDKENLEKLKQYFHQLIHILNALTNDPNVHEHLEKPFEKEVINNTMESLNIPACPPQLLAKLYEKFKSGGKITAEDLADYDNELDRELEPNFQDFYDLKNARIEYFSGKELSKDYQYWNKITEVEMYKDLLKWQTLQLILPSAGEKRLPFKFLEQVYKVINDYEESKNKSKA